MILCWLCTAVDVLLVLTEWRFLVVFLAASEVCCVVRCMCGIMRNGSLLGYEGGLFMLWMCCRFGTYFKSWYVVALDKPWVCTVLSPSGISWSYLSCKWKLTGDEQILLLVLYVTSDNVYSKELKLEFIIKTCHMYPSYTHGVGVYWLAEHVRAIGSFFLLPKWLY